MPDAASDHNSRVEIAVDQDRSFQMLDWGGRDQTVRACVAGGWRSFEEPMPEVYFSCVQAAEGAVVDIGANTGFYTLLAAVARPEAVLWAFEPDPQVRSLLEENLRLNNLADRVTVFSEAVSDRAGIASLYLPEGGHGCVETSSSLEQSFKSSHAGVVPVTVNTLDAHVAALITGRVGIIKVDVEGHEAAVLAGSAATVRGHQPWLFVEVLRGADFGALNDFLGRQSYVAIALHPAGPIHPAQTIDFVQDAWNHLLVPAGEAESVLASLRVPAASVSRWPWGS